MVEAIIRPSVAELPASKKPASRIGGISTTTRPPVDEAKIDELATDFESVFISQMLQHMFEGVGSSYYGEGEGSDIYKSMMIDEYGKILTRSGGVGVADQIKREMLKMQEVKP